MAEYTGDDLTELIVEALSWSEALEVGRFGHERARELLADAEVARQAEARQRDEGAEAVYWWAEDEVNDLRPAGVIPRHIREANQYRVTDTEGAT